MTRETFGESLEALVSANQSASPTSTLLHVFLLNKQAPFFGLVLLIFWDEVHNLACRAPSRFDDLTFTAVHQELPTWLHQLAAIVTSGIVRFILARSLLF